jgi:hypothetical protein
MERGREEGRKGGKERGIVPENANDVNLTNSSVNERKSDLGGTHADEDNHTTVAGSLDGSVDGYCGS